jgi:hypothetical protein
MGPSHSLALGLALIPAAVVTGSALAGPGDEVIRPRVLPGGVADPAVRRGYLATMPGGIVVLDLRTGKKLRVIDRREGYRPLIATDRFLVAQAPSDDPKGSDASFCVVILAVSDAGVSLRAKSHPVHLPSWVVTPERLRRPQGDWGQQSFDIDARIVGKSLLVRWRAASRYKGGANLGSQGREQANRFAASAFRIDLELIEGPPKQVPIEPREFKDPVLTRAFDELPESFQTVSSIEYYRDGRPGARPLVVGDHIVALAMARRPAAGRTELILKSWSLSDPSRGDPPRSLMTLEGDYPGLEVTLDGSHLLVEQREGAPAAGPAPHKLFSLESGKLLAILPPDPDVAACSVQGQEVFFDCVHKKGRGPGVTVERTLKAIRIRGPQGIQFAWEYRLDERTAVQAAPPPPPPSAAR